MFLSLIFVPPCKMLCHSSTEELLFFNAKEKQSLNQNCKEVALTRFCDAVTRFGLLA